MLCFFQRRIDQRRTSIRRSVMQLPTQWVSDTFWLTCVNKVCLVMPPLPPTPAPCPSVCPLVCDKSFHNMEITLTQRRGQSTHLHLHKSGSVRFLSNVSFHTEVLKVGIYLLGDKIFRSVHSTLGKQLRQPSYSNLFQS